MPRLTLSSALVQLGVRLAQKDLADTLAAVDEMVDLACDLVGVDVVIERAELRRGKPVQPPP